MRNHVVALLVSLAWLSTPVWAVPKDESLRVQPGWIRNAWVWTPQKTGATAAKRTGYYVTGWRKQPDGRWKFCLDIGGSDPR